MTGTGPAGMRCGGMGGARATWLVSNAASGSNDEAALQALEACCGDHGLHLVQRSVMN